MDIPRSAWAPWIEEGKSRQLRRALTTDERLLLENRLNELTPVMQPYSGEAQLNRVALALSDMFSGFPSMRAGEDEAVARVDSVRRVLTPYPAWAIAKACDNIQSLGVFRDGKYVRHWPPTDPEIVKEVRDCLRLYERSYRSAVDLLEATVAS